MDMKTSEVPSTSFRKPQTPKIVKTPQNPQTLVESEGGMGLDTQAFVQKEFERMLEPSQACVIQFEEENDGTLVQKSGNEDLATLTQQVQSVSELELQENSQIGKNVSMLSQLYTSDDKIDVETTEPTKPKDLLDPDENFQFTISEELKNILDSPTYPLETIHDASNISRKKSSVDGSGN